MRYREKKPGPIVVSLIEEIVKAVDEGFAVSFQSAGESVAVSITSRHALATPQRRVSSVISRASLSYNSRAIKTVSICSPDWSPKFLIARQARLGCSLNLLAPTNRRRYAFSTATDIGAMPAPGRLGSVPVTGVFLPWPRRRR